MQLNRREALLGALAAQGAGRLPRVEFGPHRVSRLIAGGNPISGNSHVSGELSREMRDYFTAARVKELLRACEAAGIDTWQSRGDRHILRLLNEHRLEGGRIQWIAQTASELGDIPRNIQECAAAGAIGIYHHGTQTDKFWAAGQIEAAREMLKVMRQTGVRVGLGTHIPEVVDHVESKDWDFDFYMTSLYNLSAGQGFQEADRERMLRRVRQASKPCLIFKVYGATRRCASRETMLEALRQTFAFAKPVDSVVIGMFPKYKEQVRENCELVRAALAT